MIDVVGVAASFVELHQVADDGDEIFLGENRLAGGTIRSKALIDLVTADASEIISLRREEQPLERLLGCLAIRRVARAEKRVDLLQRLFLGVRRILGDGVLDQHRLGATGLDEDLDLVDLALAELANHRVRERVTGLSDHFTGVGIHGVDSDDPPRRALTTLDGIDFVAKIDRRVRRKDLHLVDVEAAETVVDLLGQLVALAHEQLGFLSLESKPGLLGLQLGCIRIVDGSSQSDVLGDDGAEHFTLIDSRLALPDEIELANGKEQTQDLRVGAVAEGTEQRRRRKLLLLVDVHVHDIVDVDGELDPRAAERDDARRDQALAVRVRRLLEHDAR